MSIKMRQRESHFTVYIAQEQISFSFFLHCVSPKSVLSNLAQKEHFEVASYVCWTTPVMQMDHRYGVVLTVQDPCKESKNTTRGKIFTKVAFIHGLAPGTLLSSASLTKLEQQKFEVKSKNKKITTGVDYAYSIFTVVSTG